MANVKNYGLSGISTVVEFGKKGQKLSSTGSTFGVYEANGTSLTNILVKDGAAPQDAVAFGQMNSAISTAIGRLTAGLVYKGSFAADGATALPPDPSVGDFWKVSSAGTVLGLELAIGDMIIANATVVGASAASDFDKIDNTEAADILRTGDISSVADLASTAGGVDAKLATRGVIATYVNSQISAAGTAALVGTVSTRTVSLVFDSLATLPIGAAIPANATVVKALVKVVTPFNGTAPTVTLGGVGAADVAGAAETDLTVAGIYDITSFVSAGSATVYNATYVADSSTAGAATIILEYVNA